jgi:N-acetylglutamate synthase-like GNAT family acetyltransferase
MSGLKFQSRRATVDDLPRLRQLWALMRLPDTDLERQLTDFQVVTDEVGVVVGCLALQMNQRQARIHSEAFEDFSLADYARPALWTRIQTLATNHGLVRLWTQETSPYWSRNGFLAATGEELEKMPPIWDRSSGNWLTMKLKDEEAMTSLDKEFALFVESEKQQRHQLLGRTKIIKHLAIGSVIIIILLLIVAAAWLFMRQRSGGLTPGP